MPEKKQLFPIPACAWSRDIGDIPKNCASNSPNRGVALGGFGAGSFMYNLTGSFGPFQTFDNVIYKGEWLTQAAFHIYEKTENSKTVKCLSTYKHLKQSWQKIKKGDGRYYALQPFGWITYNCFKAEIAQKFFSPIIPYNYRETSYPAAIWQFRFYNPTRTELELSVMLAFPGFFIGEYLFENRFRNSYRQDKKIKGVILRAESGIGEWCMASEEDKGSIISYNSSWSAFGNGKDIRDDFKNKGILGNNALDKMNTAAALAVKIILKPGEERTVPLVLTWDFPVMRFGRGTEWWKKYTRYFGRTGRNSFTIARECLQNYQQWERQITEWMSPVINSNKYPDWLKCAAFNELYYNQFGGSFYEAGVRKGHKRQKYLGRRPDSNRFFIMECMEYPMANTYDVRHYSSRIFAKFWPEIEKEIQMSYADAIMYFDSTTHQTPHDVGHPKKDPYFEFDEYGTRKMFWKDLHSKFIQQIWRYYYLYKDKKFLKYCWPACKATYEFMKTTDTDNDALPNNYKSDNTYDAWGLFGTSLLCGGLWVGALQAMEKMAQAMNDPLLKEIRTLLRKAKPELDQQLWYARGGYYKIDTGGKYTTAIMSDGLNGQRYCEAYGLSDILPKERIKSHLKQVYERTVVPLKDFNGDGIGECGAINGIREDGRMLSDQGREVWTGASYFLAAGMYHAGLKKQALQTAYGVYYLTYQEKSTAYWFNTPEAWVNGGRKPRPTNPEQYQRPRAVWELLLEIHDPY